MAERIIGVCKLTKGKKNENGFDPTPAVYLPAEIRPPRLAQDCGRFAHGKKQIARRFGHAALGTRLLNFGILLAKLIDTVPPVTVLLLLATDPIPGIFKRRSLMNPIPTVGL
jgi:hypothetical protein